MKTNRFLTKTKIIIGLVVLIGLALYLSDEFRYHLERFRRELGPEYRVDMVRGAGPVAAVISPPLPYRLPSGRMVYADDRGRRVIEEEFRRAEPFANGYAVVQRPNGGWGVINREGRYLIKPVFDEINAFNHRRVQYYETYKHRDYRETTWSIFGQGHYWVRKYYLKLYDLQGRRFYSHPVSTNGESGNFSTMGGLLLHYPTDSSFCRIFEQKPDGSIREGSASKLVCQPKIRVDNDRFFILDQSTEEPDSLILCEVRGKCGPERYRFINLTSTAGEVKAADWIRTWWDNDDFDWYLGLKDDRDRFFLLYGQRGGLAEISADQKGRPSLSKLYHSSEQLALGRSVAQGRLNMYRGRPYQDGSAIVLTNTGDYYLSAEPRLFKLPALDEAPAEAGRDPKRVVRQYIYSGPEAIIIRQSRARRAATYFCLFNPQDQTYILPWQPGRISLLRKNRFLVNRPDENDRTRHQLVDGQGRPLSRLYQGSLERTASPDLLEAPYDEQPLFISVETGRELILQP